MKTDLKAVVLFLLLVAAPVLSSAQGMPAPSEASPRKNWDFSLNVAGYLVPDGFRAEAGHGGLRGAAGKRFGQ